MSQRYQGVYPVLYAFFDAEGRLDRVSMAAQVAPSSSSGPR